MIIVDSENRRHRFPDGTKLPDLKPGTAIGKFYGRPVLIPEAGGAPVAKNGHTAAQNEFLIGLDRVRSLNAVGNTSQAAIEAARLEQVLVGAEQTKYSGFGGGRIPRGPVSGGGFSGGTSLRYR